MSSSQFVRAYRKVMGQALAPYGFERVGKNYYRIRDRLLHSITLHRSNPWNFTGEFAVQPLVYPFPAFSLSFGDRIDEIEPRRTSWWETPEDPEGIERVVRDYAGLVVRCVVPWLDRFQSCSDMVQIDLLKSWGLPGLTAMSDSKSAIKLGLCALAADMPEAAREYLEFAQREYRRFLAPDSVEWFKADLRLVEDYLEMMSKGDWEGIRKKLDEGEAFTRTSLKLPPAEDVG